jgi:hypothetical protein
MRSGADVTTSPLEFGEPSAQLLAFLDATETPPADPTSRPLAERTLYVDRGLRSGQKSRFVQTGGVLLNRVTNYWLTVADLDPIAERRDALGQLRLELLKFSFTFKELPRKHGYQQIRIRINLRPQYPVMQLRPRRKTAQAQTTQSFSSEFSPLLAKLAQITAKHTASASTSRTEQLPVVTALDLNSEGFGWTYQAHDGSPLVAGVQQTMVVLELPRDTKTLAGVFDAEAIVARKLLGTVDWPRALPVEPEAPFTVTL